MKRSHEVPLCLLDMSREVNDFDYALVHLLPQYLEYYQFFVESLKQKREVFLDNSVFELGEAFEEKSFEKWIDKLNPTYYIIPDKFGDKNFTVESVKKWKNKNIASKSIGVVQGETIEELIECYDEIADLVDMVAISFAQPSFVKLFPGSPKSTAQMLGRVFLINQLIGKGVIRKEKKHHLLGCSLPQELMWYKTPMYNFLTSIDTSSPIVHSLYHVKYEEYGLREKVDTKLADLIDFDHHMIDFDLLHYNLNMFKSFMP